MLATDLNDVTEELVRAICNQGWAESATLEFKRDAPGFTDKDKQELLKDVCALANADGGDLVFGVKEVDGFASELVPICSESADALDRRIAQTIESGIEPRVLGLRTRRVDLAGGFLFVLRVPSSYHGPHGIKVNSSRRFVVRNGTTTSDLSFDQLRMAFDRTASLAERARSFIQSRTDLLAARQSPKRLTHGPIRALHFIPIGGLAGRQGMDLHKLSSEALPQLIEAEWGGGSRGFNLDGLVVFPGESPDGYHAGYVQVFRNGAMEAAALGGGVAPNHGLSPQRPMVFSLDMTEWFRERSDTMLRLAKSFGFSGPAVMCYSMLNVHDHELSTEGLRSRRGMSIPDRPHLVAPETWIDSLEAVPVDDVVRPLLDMLWQGFGWDRCPDYDLRSGKYRPRHR